jgi:hypothetical protein
MQAQAAELSGYAMRSSLGFGVIFCELFAEPSMDQPQPMAIVSAPGLPLSVR